MAWLDGSPVRKRSYPSLKAITITSGISQRPRVWRKSRRFKRHSTEGADIAGARQKTLSQHVCRWEGFDDIQHRVCGIICNRRTTRPWKCDSNKRKEELRNLIFHMTVRDSIPLYKTTRGVRWSICNWWGTRPRYYHSTKWSECFEIPDRVRRRVVWFLRAQIPKRVRRRKQLQRSAIPAAPPQVRELV